MIPPLLDYTAAAGLLRCSRSLVAEMARAAELAAAVRAGTRKAEDVPQRLQRYLDKVNVFRHAGVVGLDGADPSPTVGRDDGA